MRSLALLLYLVSTLALASEWYAVDGGIVEININQQELEDSLWKYLRKNEQLVNVERERYSYQHQVKKESMLFINAFCEKSNRLELHRQWLQVLDGGVCYFSVWFNYKTGEFSGLNINGVA